MANFFFDGTASVTAAKADNVLITANPALFTSEAQVGGNVVISYNNGTTLTVTGATLADLPGVQLSGGTFSSGNTAGLTTTTANALVFSPNAGANAINVAAGGTATSIKTVFGGLGVSDSTDGADNIVIGGKGSFLVYGNAGADAITQTTAFDSQSFVTVFGGKNDTFGLASDSITLNAAGNSGAKMAIYGGEGTDIIDVRNTGSNANTAIFGGQGAADSTDSADTITFNGGGTVNIFGNAGNDIITLGGQNTGTAPNVVVNGLDSTANATVHGGIGADNITVSVAGTAVAATIVAYGDENDSTAADSISIGGNSGTTVIYGGTAAADANDGADLITYSGQGTATIFAAGGNDSVVVNTSGIGANAAGTAQAFGNAVTANASSTTTVFLGAGNDSINVLNSGFTGSETVARGTTSITGGAGNDTFTMGVSGTGSDSIGTATGNGLSVVITDFVVGTDVLQINNQVVNGAVGTNAAQTTTAVGVTAPVNGFATLQAALNAAASVGGPQGTAATTAGTVGVVNFGNDTYVVLNNSTTGTNAFDNAADFAVKLTGVTTAAATIATAVVVI